MANTINVPRSHLIMGLCLPLAVLLGYFLAQPLESSSIAVVMLVLSLLAVPLFIKWHHPMLILCWNVYANPLFLPGRPALWVVVSAISLFFAILARSVNANRRFIQVPSITKPLIFLGIVIIGTAMLSGGIGIRSLGSERYGGKGYFYVLAAIGGYFAFTSQRIPVHKAGYYVSIFFLSGLTALIGDMALAAGPPFYYLTAFFAPDSEMQMVATMLNLSPEMLRVGALSLGGAALYAWLFSRYGLREVLSLRRPWLLFLILLAASGCLVSGFRSSIILFAITFACVFYFEGLYRTSLLPILGIIGLFTVVLVLPQADRLPLTAQRALSFIPALPINAVAKQGAQASTEWRVEMWKEVLPQVPKYLIKGKGFALDPNDLFMAQLADFKGFGIQASSSMVAGDYHNGPLSVLIPFGIFGFIGFGWLLVSGVRLLYYYHRFGDPRLQRINTFLLSGFVAKLIFFTFIFGALSSDLAAFLGLLGMAVSLNGAPQTAAEPEPSAEALTVFSEKVY